MKKWSAIVNIKSGEIVERRVRTDAAEQQRLQEAEDKRIVRLLDELHAAEAMERKARQEKKNSQPRDCGSDVADAKIEAIRLNVNSAMQIEHAHHCAVSLYDAIADGAEMLADDCPEAARVLSQATAEPIQYLGHQAYHYSDRITRMNNTVGVAIKIVDSAVLSRRQRSGR